MKNLLLLPVVLLLAHTAAAQASLQFDGVDDYAKIPNVVSSSTAFTIEFWIKTTQIGTNGGQWYNGNGLVDAEIGGVANDFGVSLNGAKIAFGIGGNDKSIFSISDVNTGNWVHVAAVWTNSGGTDGNGTMKLYINGVLEATATNGVPIANRNAPATITLGAVSGPNNYYTGSMDELRFWNVARTQAQIQDNINCTFSTATGMAAYYTFNDGTANGNNAAITTIADGTGNANTGTLYNFALTGSSSNFIANLIYPPPSVDIASSSINVYGGITINFTATPKLAGATPAYQWYKNNSLISGAVSVTYSSNTLLNGDQISCSVSSSTCISGVYSGNVITMQLIPIRTWYVKVGATGGGTSWADAGELQTIINKTFGEKDRGDTVLVAAGTYTPATNISYSMKEGVGIFAGFANTGSPTFANRDWQTYVTNLSGYRAFENVYNKRVIFNNNNRLTAAAVLDGFTIKDTYVTGNNGGAMSNLNVSPTIRNCTFTNNHTTVSGGGVYNEGSSPLFINCTFLGNQSGEYGGGMANSYSNPILNNCTFSANSSGNGGGIFNFHSNPMVSNCKFLDNNHAYSGACAYNNTSNPVFDNCYFFNNSATWGGVMYHTGSNPVFTNSVFASNTATDGGAFFAEFYSIQTFNNCIFYGNSTPDDASGGGYGGAIYNQNSTTNLFNCVLANNTAANAGYRYAAIYSKGLGRTYTTVNVGVYNTIIYNNSGGIYLSAIPSRGEANVADLRNSWIQSFTPDSPTTGAFVSTADNISTALDPLFTNPANPIGPDGIWGTADDGFLLQPCSPLVNVGANSFAAGSTDLAGNTRIQNSIVDIGAYESRFSIPPSKVIYVDSSKALSGDGKSWATAFNTLSAALTNANDCALADSILIAKGTYYPTGLQNGTNRDSAFFVPQQRGIKIYGGYPSGGGTRNITANATILSGDIGALGSNSDNSYHVLVIKNTNANADSVVIDGFTIANGNANATGFYETQTGYSAINGFAGGGAFLINSSPHIRNCTFTNNLAYVGAGILNSLNSSPKISNCVFTSNKATNDGGAMANTGSSSPAVNDCFIVGNVATTGTGGGIDNNGNCSPRIMNCAISTNSSVTGGAISNTNLSNPIITNSTITSNNATTKGGGIMNESGCLPVVANSIVWGNTAPASPAIFNADNTPAITYSIVQGGYAGTGNLSLDPQLQNLASPAGADQVLGTADDGLRLSSCSPAVDNGSNAAIPPGITKDLYGNPRIYNNLVVDMGVCELQAGLPSLTITAQGTTTFCSGGSVVLAGNTSGTWSSGQTTPSITVTTSGTYYVTYTCPAGNQTSNAITVLVKPMPTAVINGSTSVCLNATAPTITFTASNASAPNTFTYNINGGTVQTLTAPGTRYIRIQQNKTGSFDNITIAEIEALDATTGQNRAFHQAVTLSSTYQNFVGSQLTDGDINTFAHTAVGGTGAYMEIDLGAEYNIGTVRITNRADCCPTTIENVQLILKSSSKFVQYTSAINAYQNQAPGFVSAWPVTTIKTELPVPTNVAGTFTYNLLSASSGNGCSQLQTGSATVFVAVAPTATAFATPAAICAGGSSLLILPSNALLFDNTGYVAFSGPATVPVGNSSYTMEAWIKPTSMGDLGIIGWGGYGTANAANALRLSATGIVNYWWANDFSVTTGSLVGAWHHIAATFDGTTRSIYLDGQLVGSNLPGNSHNVPGNISNLTIGKTAGPEYFKGSIDEVRVWNIARTQAEIASGMYTMVAANSLGLMSYYKLDEASGTTVVNTVAGGANGTLTDSPVIVASTAPVGFTSVTWLPGSLSGASISVTPPVTTSYTATYTAYGCTVTASTTVTVNNLPTATITGGSTACQGQVSNITFTGSNANAPYTFTYTINGGSPLTVTTQSGSSVNVAVPTNVLDTYTYALVGVAVDGCQQAQSGSVAVAVKPLPTATVAGTSTICKDAAAPNITFTGAGATAPYTFTYTINGGSPLTITTLSGNSATVSAPTGTPGVFAYSLVSVASASGCQQAQNGTATVSIGTPASGSISGSTSICQGQPWNITFTGANATAPYTFTYTINGGSPLAVTTQSGNSATVAVPTNLAGTYMYELLSVSSNDGCPQAQAGSATVTVISTATAAIGGSATACQGAASNITFTGANSVAPYTFTYTINSGSPLTATTQSGNSVNVAVPTNVLGNYIYLLVSVSSNGCSQAQSGSVAVAVKPLPTATVAGTSTVCKDAAAPNITFTGAGAIAPYTFTYTINGGSPLSITTQSGNSVTVAVPTGTPGVFAYSLVSVSSASGCQQAQSGTATVSIGTPATATISGSTSICQGQPSNITFTGANATAPYTFTYTINGSPLAVTTQSGNSATVAVPTNTPAAYTYLLKSVSSGGCSQPQSGTVTTTVYISPTAVIAGSASVCKDADAPLITFAGANSTAPYTFTYTINDGSPLTVTTQSGNAVTVPVTTEIAGVFNYSLVSVSSASGCQQEQSGTAIVKVNEPITVTSRASPAAICLGSSTQLSASLSPLAAAGNSLSFDGSGYVSFTGAAAVPLANSPYTLEAWIKPTTMGILGIIGWGSYGSANGVNALRLNSTGITHYWWANDVSVNTPDLSGAWHHVAASFDGTTRTIYLDGLVIYSGQPGGGHNVTKSDNLTIGSTAGGEFFKGEIDEVRVWGIARTQADIQAGMASTVPANTSGLLSYFKMDEASGNSVVNATGGLGGELVSNATHVVPSTSPVGNAAVVWMPGSLLGASVSVSPVSTTTYTATVSASYGCTSTASTTVTVLPLPAIQVAAIPGLDVCVGAPVTLSASGSATSYSWSGGVVNGVPFIPAGNSSYIVTGTDANGCSASDTVAVTVVESIATNVGNFETNGSAYGDVGGNFTITDRGSRHQRGAMWYKDSIDLAYDFDLSFFIQQFTRDFDMDGMAFVLQNFGLQALGTNADGNMGYYQTAAQFGQSLAVQLEINSTRNGYGRYQLSVVKNNDPTVLTSPVNYDGGGLMRFTWNSTSHQLLVYLNGNLLTSYSEDVINTIFGGRSKVIMGFAGGTEMAGSLQFITVDKLIYHHSLEIKQDCGSSILSTNAAEGASFVWNTGETTPTITAQAGHTYSVTATVNGCSNTASMLVKTITAPTINAGGPVIAICPGSTAILTASTGQQYVWSNNSTTQSISVNQEGTYIAYVDGCPAQVQVAFKTIGAITANYTSTCASHPSTLTAPAGASYLWNTGGNTAAINVPVDGAYSVTVTDTAGCSLTTSTINITLSPATFTVATTVGTSVCESVVNFVRIQDADRDNYYYKSTYAWDSDSVQYSFNGSDYNSYYGTRTPGTYNGIRTENNGCTAMASLTVTGIPADADPSLFGQNKWNVYNFNLRTLNYNGNYWDRYYHNDDFDQDVDAYKGYSTLDKLSFSTDETSAGYQGCNTTSRTSFWGRRKGFPCGNYTISIPNYFYIGELWVDGVRVWDGNSTNFAPDVWTGNLGYESTVEFRVGGFYGGFGSISFQLNGSASALAATVSGTANTCLHGSSPLISFTGLGSTGAYTFTYTVNGGANQTISTAAGVSTATLAVPTNAEGLFAYSLLNVTAAGETCLQPQSGTAIVTVSSSSLAINNDLSTATIQGTSTTQLLVDAANCRTVADILPNGSHAVSGTVNAKVFIDPAVQYYPYNGQQLPYVQRHYDITPATNAGTATAQLTLYYTQAEFNAYNIAVDDPFVSLPTAADDVFGKSRLRILQYHGTSADSTGTPNSYGGKAELVAPAANNILWNSSLQRWEITFNVSGFSGFFLGVDPLVILPVKLLSFTGQLNSDNKATHLQWQVATQQGIQQYVVERSTDGNTFQSVGTIAANQLSSATYSYEDALSSQLTTHHSLYYRLKIIGSDGTISYSSIVKLSLESLIAGKITLYPNPVDKGSLLQISISNGVLRQYKLTTVAGQVLLQKNGLQIAGTTSLQLPAALAAGVYYLQLTTDIGVRNERVIVK